MADEIEELKREIENDPFDPGLYFVLGCKYYDNEQYAEAINAFLQSIEIYPYHYLTPLELGRVYFRLKRHEDGMRSFEESLGLLLETDEEDMDDDYYDALQEIHTLTGISHFELENYDHAIESFQKVIEIDHEAEYCYLNLGNAYYEKGLLGYAVENYEREICIHPENELAYDYLAMAYVELENYDKAVEVLEKGIRILPENYRMYFRSAEVYFEKEEYKKAIEMLDKVIEMDPGDVDAHINLGNCYGNLKQPERAKEYFKTAIRKDVKCVEAHFNLGMVYKELNDMESAYREYEIVKSIDPEAGEEMEECLREV